MSLTRAEKLELDAIVAPLVRSKHLGGNPINRRRPVHVYDPDTLVVTRTIPLSEATEGILATAKIELAVDEGVRPKTILCEVCGIVVSIKQGRGGTVPRTCRPHRDKARCVCGELRRKACKRCRACAYASPETREKHRIASTGRKVSAATGAKISAANRGRRHSAETRARQSEAHRGKKKSAAHRAKLSEAKRGQKISAKVRAKISAALIARATRNPATHCRAGHALDRQNVYLRKHNNGAFYRECRECKRIRLRVCRAEANARPA